ncbi:MAG: hypothetical protein AAB511_03500 [Patescibacteria group bacterium]
MKAWGQGLPFKKHSGTLKIMRLALFVVKKIIKTRILTRGLFLAIV